MAVKTGRAPTAWAMRTWALIVRWRRWIWLALGLAGLLLAARAVAGSGVDWTIVRPPRLTSGPRTERYRVKDEHLPPRGFSISYADLAHFLLNEAEQPRHVRRVVGVSR